MPLLPFLVIFAGYGFYELWFLLSGFDDRQNRIWMKAKPFFKFLMVITLFFPVIVSSRLGYLSLQNDSRIIAKDWIENNIPQGSKIVTFSPRLRVSSSRVALLEQKNIEPSSLRKIDEAEMFFDGSYEGNSFYALNLYTVSNLDFLKNLPVYLEKQGIEYLVISPNEGEYIGKFDTIKAETPKYSLAASFGSDLGVRMPGAEVFKWTWADLFKIKEFGPRVDVYRIN